MKAVLILSGGVDSTTLLYRLLSEGKEVYTLSFLYGQKHSKELSVARATCNKLNVLHSVIDISSILPLIGNSALTGNIKIPEGNYDDISMRSTVVPNRNMIFASLAIGYAVNIDADEVALGVHSGDHAIYPDCRPEFISKLRAIAQIANYKPIQIHTPYLYFSKANIVTEGLKLGVDYSLTWTCYVGDERPCGKCGACVERAEAFALNHIKDPLLEGSGI